MKLFTYTDSKVMLKQCPCQKEDLTLQRLYGKPYGGYFICLQCGVKSPAKIVNK